MKTRSGAEGDYSHGAINLGVASFDPDSGMLRCSTGEEKLLRRQSARVLAVLAKAPGTACSKDHLLNAVWGDVVVTEGSLTQCIADIRRAIGDEEHRIIQTLPKFGYRLVARGADRTVPGSQSRGVEPLEQAPVRFAVSSDGVRLAWTVSGDGPPMLKAPSWISNIEMEAYSLIYTEFYRWLGERVRLVRFDQRGSSLSDRVPGPLSVDDMVEDMRTVADSAGIGRFFLFGPSQGVAFSVAFAHKYPDRVRGIIGRGGFGRGRLARGDPSEKRKYEARKALIEAGWNDQSPSFRRFFTARLLPDAGAAISREFDEMQCRACDAPAMLANLELMVRLDVEALAQGVSCPTLLLHSRGDHAVEIDEGRRLASIMPNAEFVTIDDENHIPLPQTVGFQQTCTAIEAFLEKF